MNKEFITAVKELGAEKGIPAELLFTAVEEALVAAYKKNYGSNQNVRVDMNKENGIIRIFAQRVVVEGGGCEAITSYDVGVAGIHRLFPQIARMVEENVRAIIVCAGMEGTLPSVVAGLVDVPVIAVPTSVGYGVIVDPAAIYPFLPIVTGAMRLELQPTNALSSIVVTNLFLPS